MTMFAPRKSEGSFDSEDFIRLKDGESVAGVLRGAPVTFYQHWVGNRSQLCPGRATCDLCRAGDKGSFRFRVNMVVKSGQGLAAKIFEQGATVYDTLEGLASNGVDLSKQNIKIARKGSGQQDTTYVVIPMGEAKPESLKAIEQVELLTLDPHAAAKAQPATAGAGPAVHTEDDIPF